jgi:NAD(P)H-hydrate epimerase
MMERTIDFTFANSLLKPRPQDGHKGTFGHALIIAGKYGMAGASVLATKACLRTGVGKVTVLCPHKNNDILQIAVPEAILRHDPSETLFSEAIDIEAYDAVAIGPGIGTSTETALALHEQIKRIKESSQKRPLLMDADALNILSHNPSWADDIPDGTIITPHKGEQKRLRDAGINLNKFILVDKGHPTKIILPSNNVYTCPYGNDGMATAGSGDVLTGIITGLLAQGYDSESAAILGVTLHALAGDAATAALGSHSVIASDIIDFLPEAFKIIRGTSH